MKTSMLQNRLSISAILAVVAVTSFLIFQSQFLGNSGSSEFQSSSSLNSGGDEGVIAQVESILALSARHVFDEDYWIANMHSIRSSQF